MPSWIIRVFFTYLDFSFQVGERISSSCSSHHGRGYVGGKFCTEKRCFVPALSDFLIKYMYIDILGSH